MAQYSGGPHNPQRNGGVGLRIIRRASEAPRAIMSIHEAHYTRQIDSKRATLVTIQAMYNKQGCLKHRISTALSCDGLRLFHSYTRIKRSL